MKWSSVKTIMLALLIVMNVFLVGVLLAKRVSGEKIPPVVRSAAVEALEGGGIVCPGELLPEKYLTMHSFSGSFPTAAELSRMFFGRQLAFRTEGRTLTANEDGALLTVEDERFAYSRGGDTVRATEKELRKALKTLGIDMSRARYAGGGRFDFYYENRPVFDMYIRAALAPDGSLAEVEARWPRVEAAGERRGGLSIIGCIPDMLERYPDGADITDVRAGYTMTRNEDTGTFSFEPAWRITTEDGAAEVFGCN